MSSTLWWSEALIVIGRFGIPRALAHWVGEGLTTVFSFPVGLDVRRELTIGNCVSADGRSWPRPVPSRRKQSAEGGERSE